jgi:hypothetical protein
LYNGSKKVSVNQRPLEGGDNKTQASGRVCVKAKCCQESGQMLEVNAGRVCGRQGRKEARWCRPGGHRLQAGGHCNGEALEKVVRGVYEVTGTMCSNF